MPEADAERAIEQLARSGHRLIFTTSFGFMEPTLKVAKKYPEREVRARHRLQAAPNLATYSAKFHEGRYIMGQIAGKMTKSGTIGYVGAFPIPEVVVGHQLLYARRPVGEPRHQDQDRVGEFLVRPGKEADGAKALLDQGVDVLAQHTDSPRRCSRRKAAARSPSARPRT